MSTYEDGFGIIISLRDLRRKLQTISNGPHQWTANPLHGECDEDDRTTSFAEVWYTNPELVDMPNELGFRFPLFRDEFGSEADSLVCCHAALLEPIQVGLYFEDDRLLYDPLEDFDRFWPPIKLVLCEAVTLS